MEPNIKEFNLKRINILEDILEIIRNWDKTYEMGIDIIAKVEVNLEELKSIDKQLQSILGSIPFEDSYRDKMSLVAKEYEELLKNLEIERKKLLDFIRETRLKDKIKNSYILKEKESVFIDKDL